MIKTNNKIAQVWIETVIYTLIGLALIGMVLAFALPKITEAQNKIVIQQTISSLKVFDQTITEVLSSGEDNVRKFELNFKRGELYIDGQNDEIYFVIKGLNSFYSEPGIIVQDGRVSINSTGEKGNAQTELKLDYQDYANITFNGKDEIKKFNMATTSYNFLVGNAGRNNSANTIIELKLS